MAAIAIAVLAIAPVSAEAVDMTLRGRFTCNDGQPLADMRVELMRTRTRLLPEIWPNQTVQAAGRTGPNGEWEWRVTGGETNWRVRAVLVNNDVGVKNFPTTWHHYHDTLRTQNNRPLADYGTQVVPGAECRLWAAFKAAADGYRADTGTSSPAGKVTVLDNAPTSGVPFTPYTDVFWPGNYAPIRDISTTSTPMMRSVAQHEFAHSFRHQLDGDKAHFTYDSARFWYLRSHSSTSCSSTNHGFAFNEGWAEYWADEVPATACSNAQDFSIERNVGFELKRLQSACVGVTRGRMVQVLAQNRGRIHSMSDFSNALGCQPRRPPIKIDRQGAASGERGVSPGHGAAPSRAGPCSPTSAGSSRGRRSTLSRTSGFADAGAPPRPARAGAVAALDAVLSRQPNRAAADRAPVGPAAGGPARGEAARAHEAGAVDRGRRPAVGRRPPAARRQPRGRAADGAGRRGGGRRPARRAPGGRAAAGRGASDRRPRLAEPRAGRDPPVAPGIPAPTTPGTPVPGAHPHVADPAADARPPKPDLVVPLVVSLVYRPDPGVVGCTVSYRRANDGTVAAGASTTSVQLESPGLPTLTSTIAAVPLSPGQSQQEAIVFPGINCDPDVYRVTATVTADSANAVDESSETNNSTSRTFAPAPAGHGPRRSGGDQPAGKSVARAASPFCGTSSASFLRSVTTDRSSVVTSGQSTSTRLPAGSRRYSCTEPSGSS